VSKAVYTFQPSVARSPLPATRPKRRCSPPPLCSGCTALALTETSLTDFFVMKLTTPAMASVPYSAEAPSRSTSTRSMAAIGITSTLTELSPMASLARRRPLSRTRVRLVFRPRMLIMVPPPPPPTGSLVEATVRAVATSDIVVRPRLTNSSDLMVVRGRAFSLARRLIEEPVTSTRCIGASWAPALLARVRTATATADRMKRGCVIPFWCFTLCLLRVIVNRVRVYPPDRSNGYLAYPCRCDESQSGRGQDEPGSNISRLDPFESGVEFLTSDYLFAIDFSKSGALTVFANAPVAAGRLRHALRFRQQSE
jgi:hypothetical protein